MVYAGKRLLFSTFAALIPYVHETDMELVGVTDMTLPVTSPTPSPSQNSTISSSARRLDGVGDLIMLVMIKLTAHVGNGKLDLHMTAAEAYTLVSSKVSTQTPYHHISYSVSPYLILCTITSHTPVSPLHIFRITISQTCLFLQRYLRFLCLLGATIRLSLTC